MHHYTVLIPNAPLLIQRHFAFKTEAESRVFESWLREKGLKYEYKFEKTVSLNSAFDVVEHELELAKEHRVA